jgi:glycosyltransferase involved in cell wall biosynthesis
MRLLFLSSFYPPHERGGFEQLARDVAGELEQRGHEVQVLTSNYRKDSKNGDANGVTRSLHLQADLYHYRPVDFFVKRPAQERSNARALRDAIDRFSPDLLVVWNMWNLSRNLPYWAEQWMPGRVAYYVSSTWPIETDIHEEYWRRQAGHRQTEVVWRPVRALALAQLRRERYPPKLRFQHVVCCSQFVRDSLMRGDVLSADAGVLYISIDPKPFLRNLSSGLQAKDGPLSLLYFGNLIAQKGVHTAIEALGLLERRGLGDRVELTILGAGHPDYEARLRAMAKSLGVDDRVRFAGRVDREEVPAWLRRCDVFLFTSTGPEALARTVMEAMAAGLLVIGTRAGGQKEMLFDGENALTFQEEDAAGLAEGIVRALDDPAMRWRLAQAGQEMVLERFSLDRMVSELEAGLESIA